MWIILISSRLKENYHKMIPDVRQFSATFRPFIKGTRVRFQHHPVEAEGQRQPPVSALPPAAHAAVPDVAEAAGEFYYKPVPEGSVPHRETYFKVGRDIGRADMKSQVRQCLGFCKADFWSSLARLRPIQKLRLGDTIAIQALYRVHVCFSDTIQDQDGPAGFSL